MLLKGIDEKPDSPDDTFFLCYIFFVFALLHTLYTSERLSSAVVILHTRTHFVMVVVVSVAFFLLCYFFFRCRLAWPHQNIWVQNVILLLFKSNNYEHGHRRSARDRKDGRWSGKKKHGEEKRLCQQGICNDPSTLWSYEKIYQRLTTPTIQQTHWMYNKMS